MRGSQTSQPNDRSEEIGVAAVVVGQRSYEFSHGMRFPGFCRDWMAVYFLLINGRAARKPSATIRARA